MVWAPLKSHFQQRPPLHITFRMHVGQQDWGQAKPVNGIPPPNQWTLRAEEPMGRTVSAPHCKRAAEGLESVAHSGIRSTQ